MPSLVRARISARSNSASPPSTLGISRPCGVVVQAQIPASAPQRAIAIRYHQASTAERVMAKNDTGNAIRALTKAVDDHNAMIAALHDRLKVVEAVVKMLAAKLAADIDQHIPR